MFLRRLVLCPINPRHWTTLAAHASFNRQHHSKCRQGALLGAERGVGLGIISITSIEWLLRESIWKPARQHTRETTTDCNSPGRSQKLSGERSRGQAGSRTIQDRERLSAADRGFVRVAVPGVCLDHHLEAVPETSLPELCFQMSMPHHRQSGSQDYSSHR